MVIAGIECQEVVCKCGGKVFTAESKSFMFYHEEIVSWITLTCILCGETIENEVHT